MGAIKTNGIRASKKRLERLLKDKGSVGIALGEKSLEVTLREKVSVEVQMLLPQIFEGIPVHYRRGGKISKR